MASLMPSLSSDEDEDPSKKIAGGGDGDSSESSEDDRIDESFEFGGILGEDGGAVAFSSHGNATAGWSYRTALNNIESHGAANKDGPSASVPRMDVAALIAAKRKTINNANRNKESSKPQSKSQHKKEDEEDASASGSDSDSGDDNSSTSSSSSSSSSTDDDEEQDESHRDLEEDVLKTRAGKDGGGGDGDGDDKDDSSDDEDESIDEDREEARKAAAFFDNDAQKEQSTADEIKAFSQLTLSRPILRGIAAMGYVQPTPIQASVIPLALAGRDVCASAVTGSGKTAAFLLPLLERCLHLSGRQINALILVPTRELAAQCIGMMTTLAQHTKLRGCLIVGGNKNMQAQAAELKSRPDLVVGTPGRLLDHITNTPGVSLDYIDYLVLDEADRLLEIGFQEEVHELIKACPINRQTLLFSATMNTKVDDLIQLSLKRPVRVNVSSDDKESKHLPSSSKPVEVAPRLEQEFVRVRSGNEGINREAMLLSLLTRTFTKRCIVFFDTKAVAHRLMILCGLIGLKCTELHGNLAQKQRLQALEDFRNGEVDILLATDLAARGLDIDLVSTVINFEMPIQVENYVHRIGRTARAGRGGRSCTLIGEPRRHLMKELIKDAESKQKRKSKDNNKVANTTSFETGLIRSRAIPPAVVQHFASKIQSLEPHIQEVLQAEEVARMDRFAEMEAIRAQNIIEHSDEIQSRPKREWFVSESKKKLTKQQAADRQKMIEEKAGTGMHRMTRKKRRAREALAALNAAQNEDNDDDGSDEEGTRNGRNPVAPLNIKAAARQKKRANEARSTRGDGDLDFTIHERTEKKKKKKVGQDAVGDSSLFDEERVSYASQKKKQNTNSKQREEAAASVAKSGYAFRGHDPLKKLGKKKGVKSFKSKSKFKRRK